MPRGIHTYTCLGCGLQDTCGDCIPSYCPGCQKNYDDKHPGEGCPCFSCSSRYREREIQRKLIEVTNESLVNTENLRIENLRLTEEIERLNDTVRKLGSENERLKRQIQAKQVY
jgi:hypothetical protein